MTFLGETKIGQARKPHKCSECSRGIAKGQSYTKTTWVDNGSVHTAKTCNKCNQLRGFLESHDWDFADWTYSLQTAAFEHSLNSPEARGRSCPIRSELSGLVRDSGGFWVVEDELVEQERTAA